MRDYDQMINDESVCGHCGKRVVTRRVARYEHEDCEGREDDSPRRQEAIRQLHRDTARMLRRQGFAERAAIHEFFAGRGLPW